MNLKLILIWLSRLIIALILLQTLYFKFGSHPESIYIFTQVGIEPWGRYLTGILELMASVLILIPATAFIGAILSAGLMSGAILTHLTILGIEVQDDGGYLFILALIVFFLAIVNIYIERKRLIRFIQNFI